MEPGTKAKDNESIVPVSEIDLHALAECKGEVDDFLTIYLTVNIRDDRTHIASRLKTMAKAMPPELEEVFSKTQTMAKSGLTAVPIKGERGRIIFASEPRAIMQVYRLGVELDPLVVWDRSPFLLPLARLRKDYEDYGLLLIDSQEARLFLVRSGVAEEMEKRSIDLMNKHKKGGWSQMRFNRLRKGAIKAFLAQVVQDLHSLDIQEVKGLVVAGPGEAKGQLVEMLPLSWKSKVLGIVDASMQASSSHLMKLGNEVVGSERSREKILAEELKEAVFKGRPAAFGLDEVGEALKAGRVNHLLLSNRFSIPQMICKRCHFHGEGETCPTCGGQMQALGLEELYQQAERTEAEVVLVAEDDFLESIGGIGAMLRY